MSAAVATPGPAAPIDTDAVVIGAGPVGLFQVFELGLLELRAHVIDALPVAGGQCIELYADKPIYDIPATKVCTGRELVARLLAQIEPFVPTWHLGHAVHTLARQADGRFLVEAGTTRLLARTVFVAAGVGAFLPRRLKVDGLAPFEDTQVFHALPDAERLGGQQVLIAGDGDAALEAAIALAERTDGPPASVTLMHRRDEFRAAPSTIATLQALRAAGRIAFVAAQPLAVRHAAGRLQALAVLGADGSERDLPLDTLIVLMGLSPKLGPVAEWGLALERKQVVVNTASFETSEPGIFAVGDVNTYPGKRKLIVSGFHEATLAAYGAAARIFPGRPIPLEYTTTSPRVHRALGVTPPHGS